MPRGKFINHKGRSRHFTSPEELAQETVEVSSSEESSFEGYDGPSGSKPRNGAKPKPPGKNRTSNEISEEESDDRYAKKGVSSLIEIDNPNRAVKKATRKVSKLNIASNDPPKTELSRREREQIKKQKARLRYEKLHAEGKTAQAKADLARLALIKQQREDAAAKRELEKKHN